MADDVLGLREEECGDGTSHPELVALGASALVYGPVGVAERPRDPRMRVLSLQVVQVGQVVADHVHRHLARDLAGRVPTHPIRDYKQAAVSVGRSVQ